MNCSSLKTMLSHILLETIRILRPLIKIRFASFPSKGLGFMASEPSTYLAEKRLSREKSLDIFCPPIKIANEQLLTMWQRRLFFVKGSRHLYQIAQQTEKYKTQLVPWRAEQYFDSSGLLDSLPPPLSFTPEELKRGRKFLESCGLGDSDRFVCLSARDAGYDSLARSSRFAQENSHRNTKIEDFALATTYLTEEGYYVFRMGSSVQHPMHHSSNKCIDYANLYRNDFLDIFLCAHCHFYLGDGGGLVNVARLFKRPVALVNWLPVGLVNTAHSDDLIIHKRLMKNGKALSLAEQVSSSYANLIELSSYEAHDLKIIDNSAEEIQELAQQMREMQDGCWHEPEDYPLLQKEYWTLYTHDNLLHEPRRASVGYEFAKRYLG